MRQKIYIDNNDEITTIIEKLRAAQAVDVIMVVSQNSLLLQSVINIRLLKREAIKGHKKITLATHDEEGAAIAERVGIPVDRNYSEYTEGDEIVEEGAQQVGPSPAAPGLDAETVVAEEPLESSIAKQHNNVLASVAVGGVTQGAVRKTVAPTMDGMVVQSTGQTRVPSAMRPEMKQVQENEGVVREEELEAAWTSSQTNESAIPPVPHTPPQTSAQESALAENLGTDQFFSASQKRARTDSDKKDQQEQERSLINADLVTGASISMEANEKSGTKKKKNKAAPIITVQQTHKEMKQKQEAQMTSQPIVDESVQSPPVQNNTANDEAPQKESLISDFYQQEARPAKKKANNKTSSYHHGGHGVFARLTKIVAALALVIAFITAVFIFLPKTEMHILLKRATESTNLKIDALTSAESIDVERRVIPGQMIAIDVTHTDSFPATQEVASSQQKARGQVTLFNEYSTDEQQLVATTRLESSDGKIFRLIKGVNIPGVTDGEPGKIKVDVVADRPGSEYDIAPGKFTIPGLAGSQKVRKIYGQSDEPMRGGGSSGDGLLAVSENDIEEAKKKMEEAFPDSIRSQIADIVEQNGGGIFLEDTIEVGEMSGSASVAVETAVDTFDYTLTAPVRVISFSGADVTTILDDALLKKISSDSMKPEDAITVVYGDAEADYDKEALVLAVSGQGSYVASVDEGAFREDVLGKTIEEISDIVHEKYDAIEKIDFHFTPNISFLTNKLSTLDKMLIITFE